MPTSLSLDTAADVTDVYYNGFYFPPARHASIDFVDDYSDDGRTVKQRRVEMTIDFVLVEGMGGQGPYAGIDRTPDNLDNSINTMLRRLGEPCQPLSFKTAGLGDFQVNVNNS